MRSSSAASCEKALRSDAMPSVSSTALTTGALSTSSSAAALTLTCGKPSVPPRPAIRCSSIRATAGSDDDPVAPGVPADAAMLSHWLANAATNCCRMSLSTELRSGGFAVTATGAGECSSAWFLFTRATASAHRTCAFRPAGRGQAAHRSGQPITDM